MDHVRDIYRSSKRYQDQVLLGCAPNVEARRRFRMVFQGQHGGSGWTKRTTIDEMHSFVRIFPCAFVSMYLLL